VTALQMMTNRIKEQIHFLTTKLIDNLWTESCRGRSGRKPPHTQKKKKRNKNFLVVVTENDSIK
jgi:hypothetical protein